MTAKAKSPGIALRVWAFVATGAMALTGTLALAGNASAADNPHIKFSNTQLQKLGAGDEPVSDNSQLTVEDKAKFSFSWNLEAGQTLNDGDSFAVTIPPQLKSAITSAGGLGTPSLMVDHNGDGSPETAIGTCLVVPQEVRCTFNAKAKELMDGGWRDVKGNVSVQLQAVQATTEEALPFTFTGATSPVLVDLPGNGGIKAKVVNPFNFAPSRFAKGSQGIGTGVRQINYNVPIGFGLASKTLGQYLKDAGYDQAFDGTQVHSVTFTDKLGSGQRFFGPEKWSLYRENTPAGPQRLLLDTGAPGATTTADGEFSIDVELGKMTPDGQVARITITGPFTTQANYSLQYSVCSSAAETCDVPDGRKLPELKPGFNYDNEIVADGTLAKANLTRSFAQAFTSDVTMSLGYGTFAVTKFVAGPGASLVADGAEFPVIADYTLPAAASTYPNWVAPGTLNQDNVTGTVELRARVGSKVTFYGPSAPVTFPANTRVTLREIAAPAQAPEGYVWDSHTFEVGGAPGASFTINDQKITAVKLTNRLRSVPKYPIKVIKRVEGGPASAANHRFAFSYSCGGSEGVFRVNGDGEEGISDETFLPGTVCTVEEVADQAQLPNYDLPALPQPQQVTIAEDGAALEFVNAYTRQTGSFMIKKGVTGGPVDATDKDYRFVYQCQEPNAEPGRSHEVTVKGNGVPVDVNAAIPVGHECRVAELGVSAIIPGYSLAPVPAQTITILANEVNLAEFENVYTKDAGSIEVRKEVAGPDAALAAQTEFEFSYTCTPAEGAPVRGDFNLTGGNSKVLTGLPVGTCTLTETGKNVANADVVTKIAVGNAAPVVADSVNVTVVKDQKVDVVVTNEVTGHKGTFSVAKTVQGGPATASANYYTFTYNCGGVEGEIVARGDGTAVPAGRQFAAGTVCTVGEKADSAQIPGYTLTEPLVQEIPIAKDGNTQLSFTNVYSQQTGTFHVKKTVTGIPAAAAAAKDYTFNWTCGQESGTITAKGDGAAVAAGQQFPTGTECTVTEDAAAAAVRGYELTVPAAQTFTIATGDDHEAAFANAYTVGKGDFTVQKKVSGTGADLAAGKEFNFQLTCRSVDGAETTETFKLAAGATKTFTDVPAGACAVEERDAEIANTDLRVVRTVDGAAVTTPAIGVVVEPGTSPAVVVENVYTAHVGTFTVAKSVTGVEPAGKDFTFNWTCGQENGNLTVKGDGVAVAVGKDFRAGTSCTITEDAAGAVIAGYNLSVPPAQTIAIVKGETKAVTFTNAYTRKMATFQVKKAVTGVPAAEVADKDFTFNWTCGQESGTLTAKGDGVAVAAGQQFPVGSSCSVTEDAASAAIDNYTLTAPAAQTVEIVEGAAPAEITFTNTYARKMGSFEVKKAVAGIAAAKVADKDFTFNWTCGQESGTLTAKGDGVAVAAGKQFPTGTECTVTENAATAGVLGYTLTAPVAQTFTVTEGAPKLVTVTNTYAQDKGGFTLEKKVSGTGADLAAGKQFKFNWTCLGVDGTESSGVVTVEVGKTATFSDLPVGACGLQEIETAVDNADFTAVSTVDGEAVTTEFIGVPIIKGKTTAVVVDNVYTAHVGSFQVKKTVSGGPASVAAKDFTFNWTCGGESGILTAKGDGVAVPVGKNFRVGTKCTVSEDATNASETGFTLAAPAPVEVTIVKDGPVEATFVNTYVRDLGSFTVTKTVAGTGSDLAKDKAFSFDYTCTGVDGAEKKGAFELKAGQSKTVEEVPTGKCVVTEADAAVANTDLVTAFTAAGVVTAGSKVEFDVDKGAAVVVAAANTYTAHVGSLTLAKTVKGADATGKDFKFSWTCGEASGQAMVKGDGVAVEVAKDLRVGTLCTVTEDAASAALSGYTLAPQAPQTAEIAAKDQVVAIKFENVYTKVVVPGPTATPTPAPSAGQPSVAPSAGKGGKGGKLAKTGSDAIVVGSAALALLAGGVFMLMLRRRKEQ
ncbi:MAG: DUF5979 domain-containing protein [Buchananella hordeovulneris]|nr:DUF5979 domain-containing protein [Buchananella hordeovulneris]